MKNLKNLLLIGLGSFGLFGNKSYSQNAITETNVPQKEIEIDLAVYNKKNKQVYEDFVNFMKDKEKFVEPNYSVKINRNSYDVDFMTTMIILEKYLKNPKTGERDLSKSRKYVDKDSDGFIGNNDRYVEYFPKSKIMVISGLSSFEPKKQLKIVREYTKTQKKIMHNAKYKNY